MNFQLNGEKLYIFSLSASRTRQHTHARNTTQKCGTTHIRILQIQRVSGRQSEISLCVTKIANRSTKKNTNKNFFLLNPSNVNNLMGKRNKIEFHENNPCTKTTTTLTQKLF